MIKFCPACGENVETYVVNRQGSTEVCCIHCGMLVEGMSSKNVAPAKLVLAADDSPMIRELLKEVMVTKSLADNVIGCTDGVDFLITYTNKLKTQEPVSLVILDVAMPMLNGINAAMALRAIEKGFQLRPAPILFFTAYKCDENFQKVLAYCKPAEYVNKGVSSTPEQLELRVSQVATKLLAEQQQSDESLIL